MKNPDFATMTAAQLNDWYEQTVGYRPQVDDPSMTDESLRQLCGGMWDEIQAAGPEEYPEGK